MTCNDQCSPDPVGHGARCSAVLTVQLPDAGDGEERMHCEEFEFADLRFIKSSRMSKRRLAFVLQVQVCP